MLQSEAGTSNGNNPGPLALSFEDRLRQLIEETSAAAVSLEDEISPAKVDGSSWANANWTR